MNVTAQLLNNLLAPNSEYESKTLLVTALVLNIQFRLL